MRPEAGAWPVKVGGGEHRQSLAATTGNRSFAESKKLWREPSHGLSVKNSRRRQKLSVKSSSPRANRLALGEEFLRREFFFLLSAKKFLKNHFFTFKLFLPSTCTYTKDIFKFETILFMFAIFKKITSF
jgi:hypothetical protein